MGRTATATTSKTDGRNRKLADRTLPFAGLALTVPGALLAGVIVHTIVKDKPTGLAITTGGIVAGTALLAHLSYHVAAGRRALIRWHLTVSIVLAGLGEAITVAVGAIGWWMVTFILIGLFLAGSWCLYRLDSLRQSGDSETAEDPLTRKLGLENTRFGKPKQFVDQQGDVTRIEVPVRHTGGETVSVVQAAVPAIESLANAPRGRSRVVPGENAGTSMLTIVTKDMLQGAITYPGPSAPGASITEPLVTGMYEDQELAKIYLAGGHPEAPNPSSRGWMGMTRTGKTMEAQISLLEIVSRRHVAPPMWFDTVKGAQTVRPLRDGLGIIVASDDPRVFRFGMKALCKLVRWRADRLGECGYRTWEPRCAEDPRLLMGLLYAHFEECDELCDTAAGEMVFLASKGLSAGVVCGFSLQRASAEGMPTALRFNIGTWSCFGCGDSYSASFALSDATIDAGAHPENWKQSKPGYHYTEGIGIPEDRWPVVRKAFLASDEQMETHISRWAPHLTPLDQGSINALGDWYTDAAETTQRLRARWVSEQDITVTTSTPKSVPEDTKDSEDAEDAEMVIKQMKEDVNEMRKTGAIPAQIDPEADMIDPSQPIAAPPADDLSWGDDKKFAPTREDALKAFERALNEIANDETLRDGDDTGVTFQVALLVDRYKFRSRPWFSEQLTELVDGDRSFPGLTLSRTGKVGEYRLTRSATIHQTGNSA